MIKQLDKRLSRSKGAREIRGYARMELRMLQKEKFFSSEVRRAGVGNPSARGLALLGLR
jgi:hypothetical protein